MSDDYHYRCIVADPPWNERGAGKIKRGADRHYPLLKPHAIIEAMLRSPLWRPAPNCHLWLWATCNHLPQALDVMRALGFGYRTHIVWIKSGPSAEVNGRILWSVGRPGLGQYLRGVHELLLLGVRGTLRWCSKRTPSAVVAPRGKHSEKPAVAYEAIEEVSPGPRAEMFATCARIGWDSWGKVDGEERTTCLSNPSPE